MRFLSASPPASAHPSLSPPLQATPNQHPNIDAANLSLSQVTKYEVSGNAPHHRQFIRYQNGRLQLLTPNFHSFGLRLNANGDDYSVLVPIDPWLRQQFNVTETFMRKHIAEQTEGPLHNAVYKPLWDGNMMYVRVARWCQIYQQNMETGQYSVVDLKSLGRGTYNITIEVSYLFIGPHKNGEDCSLTVRIIQITCQPDSQKPVMPPPDTIPVKPAGARGRRRKPQLTKEDTIPAEKVGLFSKGVADAPSSKFTTK